jgi:chitosanase
MPTSRRRFLLSTIGAVTAATSARAIHEANEAPVSSADTHESEMPARIETPETLAANIKAISNVFEVGRPEPEYDYVEWLHDGRGYTVTNYGFCTGTGEVALLIGLYAAVAPDTPLKRFLPLMPPASAEHGDLEDFPAAWREEIKVSDKLAFACDKEADRLFFDPAMLAAHEAGVRTPVGKLIFYDTLLQHGGGDDPDSFNAIFARAQRSMAAVKDQPEAGFLHAFLKIRKSVLLHPAEHSTRSVWRESAPRIDALARILDTNPGLVPPITVANAEVHAIVG